MEQILSWIFLLGGALLIIYKAVEYFYYNIKNYRFFRKFKGGTWYKHEFTLDAEQLTLSKGYTFWARYGEINRYSKVINKEVYK